MDWTRKQRENENKKDIQQYQKNKDTNDEKGGFGKSDTHKAYRMKEGQRKS